MGPALNGAGAKLSRVPKSPRSQKAEKQILRCLLSRPGQLIQEFNELENLLPGLE